MLLMLLCSFWAFQSSGQQWFTQQTSLVTGALPPDFRPAGTFIHEFNPDGVVLYGSIGYNPSGAKLTVGNGPGQEGGHGNTDIVIIKNEFDGTKRWELIFGSGNRDVVSQVIEDAEGNLVVSGTYEADEVRTAFISKIEVVDNGGTFSFNILWTQEYGDWLPTDLFEIFDFQTSRGYSVVGYSSSHSYVFKMDKNGSTTAPGFWSKTYSLTEGGKLYSGVQLKTFFPPEEPGGGEFPSGYHYKYSSGTLFICGYEKHRGYIVALHLDNGNVLYDKSYSMDYWEPYLKAGVLAPECTWDMLESNTLKFFEIIQSSDGDLVCGGETDNNHVLFKVNTLLDIPRWMTQFGTDDPGETPRFFDVLETNLNLLAITEGDDGSVGGFNTSQIDLISGAYISDYHVVNANSPYTFLASMDNSDITKFPRMDVSLECDILCHMSAAIKKGTSGSGLSNQADDVPHIKLHPLLDENDCPLSEQAYYSETCSQFIDPYFGDGIVRIQAVSNLNFVVQNLFAIHERNLLQSAICASQCTNSVCSPTLESIYICSTNRPLADLEIPNAGWYTNITWSTGQVNDELITVTAIGVYYAYALDQDGCLQSWKFDVQWAPAINLTPVTTQVSCNGADDGEICFTSSVQVVSAGVTYVYNGVTYASIVNLNSSSFCFSDIISQIHQDPGYSGLEPGTYSITVYDQHDCSETLNIQITEPDRLEIIPTFNCEDPGQCDGSIEINVTGGTPNYVIGVVRTSVNGTWSNGTFVNPTLPLTVSGLCRYDGFGDVFTYKINVIDANGCVETHSNEIDECGSVPFETGISGIDEEPNLSVYPNPVFEALTVKSEADTPYKLFDGQGRMLMVGNLEIGENQLNLSSLPEGTYFLETGNLKTKVVKMNR